MSSVLDLVLWVAYPYIALTIFVVGLILRFNRDPYGWTSKSSELLEKKWLRVGSLMFHWGFLIVVVGHVIGLLVPASVDESLGISTETYHALAFYAGSISGLIATIGVLILFLRRILIKRIRATSDADDFFTLTLLLIVLIAGLVNTLGYTTLVGPYDYRVTIGVWVRGLLTFHPQPQIMASVPLSYQIHVLLGLFFFAALPFTRLVHIFSLPVPYLWRRYIVYRRISQQANERA